MALAVFIEKCAVYILSFAVTWYAMTAVNYERFLKKGHVRQAQILYFLIVLAVAYLVGSFALAFIYQG
jgi:uncharacterized integral membrane protein (TIGR02327 family)